VGDLALEVIPDVSAPPGRFTSHRRAPTGAQRRQAQSASLIARWDGPVPASRAAPRSRTTAAERRPNLTVKKILKVVLTRCEWGRDDYSLNVANLPMAQEEPQVGPRIEPRPLARPPRPASEEEPIQGSLFGDGDS